HVRHGAKRRKLFDWLMRRPIFANANRVMRENVNWIDLHQRAQAHAGPHVIAEIEKRGGKGTRTADRNTIHRGPHRMFSDTEMNVPTIVFLWEEISRAFKQQVGLI